MFSCTALGCWGWVSAVCKIEAHRSTSNPAIAYPANVVAFKDGRDFLVPRTAMPPAPSAAGTGPSGAAAALSDRGGLPLSAAAIAARMLTADVVSSSGEYRNRIR
jgi:hypothetical protein